MDKIVLMKDNHFRLQRAFDNIQSIRTIGIPSDMATDTAFAIGEALGSISKAKALLGRDIDQATKASSNG